MGNTLIGSVVRAAMATPFVTRECPEVVGMAVHVVRDPWRSGPQFGGPGPDGDPVDGKFTLRELQNAFTGVVASMENWKFPIDTVVYLPSLRVVENAIMWFTGSLPYVMLDDDNGTTVRVRAPGYYNSVGA